MNHLISFESNKIRKIWRHEQWYFSVIDIVASRSGGKTYLNR